MSYIPKPVFLATPLSASPQHKSEAQRHDPEPERMLIWRVADRTAVSNLLLT